MASFKEAFAAARKAGKKEFSWNGKSYNTKLKEEAGSAPSKSKMPQARPERSSGRGSAQASATPKEKVSSGRGAVQATAPKLTGAQRQAQKDAAYKAKLAEVRSAKPAPKPAAKPASANAVQGPMPSAKIRQKQKDIAYKAMLKK